MVDSFSALKQNSCAFTAKQINARLAQLVESLLDMQVVTGSSPVASTIYLFKKVKNPTKSSLSSVGRVPARHAGCHWFESSSEHHFLVLQHPTTSKIKNL